MFCDSSFPKWIEMQMSKTQLPITLSTLLPHAILHGDFSVLFFREHNCCLCGHQKVFFPPLWSWCLSLMNSCLWCCTACQELTTLQARPGGWEVCVLDSMCVWGSPSLQFVPHFVSITNPSLTLAWFSVIDSGFGGKCSVQGVERRRRRRRRQEMSSCK